MEDIFKSKEVINQNVFMRGKVLIIDFNFDNEGIDVKKLMTLFKSQNESLTDQLNAYRDYHFGTTLVPYIQDKMFRGIISNVDDDIVSCYAFNHNAGHIKKMEVSLEVLKKYRENIKVV